MRKRTYAIGILSDGQLKEQGNKLFSARKYEDAINCYTTAIMKNPTNPIYFTNRALCHLKMKQWDQSCQDCRKALDMDQNLVKAHFFLGESLMELEFYNEAIKHLQSAYDLAKEQKSNFGNDIASQLLLARKKLFNIQEEKRMTQEIQLQCYLRRLILEDRENRIAKLKIGDNIDVDSINEKTQEILQESDDHMTELDNIFATIDDRRMKRRIPGYLFDGFSSDIITDPVITPSGYTYERKVIEELLQDIGPFDPVTLGKLTRDQLIPNLAMKEVVDDFITKNEWYIEY